MQRQYTKWKPAASLKRHAGGNIPQDMVFFVEPPSSIGKIISVDSTLIPSKRSYGAQVTVLISGVVFGLLGGFLMALLFHSSLVICVLTGILISGSWFVFCLWGFTFYCSYVGELGVSLCSLQANFSKQSKTRTLLFRDAAYLYTTTTRKNRRSFSAHTEYNYHWFSSSGHLEYKLKVLYFSAAGIPEDNLWHFSIAAENAWCVYLLNHSANPQFKKNGYVKFPIRGKLKSVLIGSGYLEFEERSGICHRVNVADMQDIRLGNGVFKFKHKDSTWWSGRGKYSFSYSSISNAKLFLVCLERLTGIRWN